MPNVGDSIVLSLQLFDGATNKYPRARVFDADGSEISGSPVALTHVAGGLYRNAALTMPDSAQVEAQYKVYDDAGFTTPSTTHSDALDVIYKTDVAPDSLVISDDDLVGVVSSEDSLSGSVSTDDLTGKVEDC